MRPTSGDSPADTETPVGLSIPDGAASSSWQLFDAIDAGATLHAAATGKFLKANQPAMRMFAVENAGEIVGKHPGDFSVQPTTGEDPRQAFARQAEKACEHGVTRFPWQACTRGGRTINLEVCLTRVAQGPQAVLLAQWTEISSHQVSQQALRASEERYRRLVEGLDRDYVIYGHDLEGSITHISPSVEAVLGFKPKEVIGHNWREFMASDASLQQAEHFESMVFRGESTPPNQLEIKQADGPPKIFEVVSQSVYDDQGRIIGVEGICKDVTELTRNERRLVEATQDLDRRVRERTAELSNRLAFEELLVNLSTGFINLPVEKIDAGINRALHQIGDFIGVDRCCIYKFDREPFQARITHQWVGPGIPSTLDKMQGLPLDPLEWELEFLRVNPTWSIPDVTNMPPEAAAMRQLLEGMDVKSAVMAAMVIDGETLGLLGLVTVREQRLWSHDDLDLVRVLGGVLVNTMNRHQAEQALRLSEERLRMAFESVEDGLFDWDIPKSDLFVSDYTLHQYGLPEGENHRDPTKWLSLIHPDDRRRVEEALNRHMHGDAPKYDVEYRLRNTKGGYGWRHARGRIVQRGPNKEPLRMLGVDRDITERVQQQEQLRKLEAQLTHLGRVATMGETVAGIAHEINQPLHAAATFCAAAGRALNSGRPDALRKGAALYGKVSEQVSRAGDIIRRLREFTRPQPAKLVDVDLNHIVRDSMALLSQVTMRSRAHLSLKS